MGGICSRPAADPADATNPPPERQPAVQAASSSSTQPTATPAATTPAAANEAEAIPVTPGPTARASTGPKVAVIYYSTYGHIRTMVHSIKEGLEASGAQVDVLQFPETLSAEILGKMGAPPKADDPVVTVPMLTEYDAFMFGIPARYGMFPAQFKQFWDGTGSHWQSGALVGKPWGVFVSTGTQNGGQETIGLTLVPQMAHHGMPFIPLGYRDPKVFSNDEPHGASPYGAGTLAGPDGSRQPSELEKGVAFTHGKSFGEIAARLAGKA
eukprot:CAMPEP_0206040322 /NCGR_PEP_ID=MMETSP1466-20131121/5311_1 /ASSEMBLY_ACC=CAM_ASM_001126 /TAXON_ID=44452 /ORGANISM="Pavlova gyrans, Strain CCMP608" /LENGTH=267 /DNA_ID=CAMNT_0053414995 /DNA_START=56 /DNA_END=859 /DNA_ORIENTATION=+